MKTTTFKGVLVDMACASNSSAATGSASTAAGSATTSASTSAGGNSNSSTGGSCPVSATSNELGMKLDNGQTVRFDLVGTMRAQDQLKTDKHWTKDLTDNKPIHATVSGVLDGDKLIVSSIH